MFLLIIRAFSPLDSWIYAHDVHVFVGKVGAKGHEHRSNDGVASAAEPEN